MRLISHNPLTQYYLKTTKIKFIFNLNHYLFYTYQVNHQSIKEFLELFTNVYIINFQVRFELKHLLN